MEPEQPPVQSLQGIATDKLLYFFLGLRKGEMRRRVAALRRRYPGEPPAILARRLVEAQAPVSFLGGTLIQLPMVAPGVGHALRLAGVAGGTALLAGMHIVLILEIALVFDFDVDERARLDEILTVALATALVVAGSPALGERLGVWSLPVGGAALAFMSQVVGEVAIRYYTRVRAAIPTECSVVN